ncbi:hypothetical protein DASB73_017180 [Starmerella bacillaris]|uniref:Prenyltransferase alpha-alpha toroid domain-containing protein n=1 Tax=Starmerella bacillaris TaxID=1247836 RepID=A0AAV5RH85_STABA|nr:hypothetical protein DASB73_017180 [Starmerella bacillaris]
MRSAKYFERVLTLAPLRVDAEHCATVYFCVLGLSVLAKKEINDTNGGEAEKPCRTGEAGTILGNWKPKLQQYIEYMFTGDGFRASSSGVRDTELLATYFGLAIAAMINYEFNDADKNNISTFVLSCRQKKGMYCNNPTLFDEYDLNSSVRHTYAAFASLKLLGKNINDLESFERIKSLQNYDGGFGMCVNDESHAGLTFCALASLELGGSLSSAVKHKAVRFLLNRKVLSNGFNGRPNKDPDCCYSFWVLNSLRMMGIDISLNTPALVDSNQSSQTEIDFMSSCFDSILHAFSPIPDSDPDPYHTALALAALFPESIDHALVIL